MSDKLPPLSPEKMREFDEFIWRSMGRLDTAQWSDLLDPNTELGRAARAFYESLAENKNWEDMTDYLAPMGSKLLSEHLPEDEPLPPT